MLLRQRLLYFIHFGALPSIRQIAQDVLCEAHDGITWIALYKESRSWNAECFWGLIDKHEVFTTD